MNEHIPKAPIRVRRSLDHRDPYWILEIAQCPFCEKPNNHGGGSIDRPPLLGSQLCHCVTGSLHEYELVPAEVNP